MQDSYHGATVDGLREARISTRLLSLARQSSLFPHEGTIELRDTQLVLSNWLTLTPDDIVRVRHDFIPEYDRFAAGGARGGFPSLGFFKGSGAPLVLDLCSGQTIVLLVGFSTIPGTTKNAEWYAPLLEFARAEPPRQVG